MTDKLFDSIQMAAGQLPEGWIVELCIERGAGWVELYDPDGDRHELKEMPDASLAEEIDAAVDEAQRASGLAPSPTQETPVAHCCHEWVVVRGVMSSEGYHYNDRCKLCDEGRERYMPLAPDDLTFLEQG